MNNTRLSSLCYNASKWILFMVLLLVPFVCFPYIDNMFRLPKEVFANVMIVMMAGISLVGYVERRYGRIFSDVSSFPNSMKGSGGKVLTLILLFSLYTIFNLIISTNRFYSLRYSFNILVYILLFFMVREYVRGEERIGTILIDIIIAGGALTGLYAIIQYMGYDPLFHPVESYMKGFLVTSGFIDNPNLLGGYLVGIVPLSLFRLLSSKGVNRKTIYLAALILVTLALILTMARTAYLALILTAFYIYLLLDNRSLKVRLLRAAVGIVAALALFMTINHYVMGKARRDLGLSDKTISQRSVHWLSAYGMISSDMRSFLIGKGAGSFRFNYPDYRKVVIEKYNPKVKFEIAGHAHNEYLQLWVEFGLIGLSLSAAILFYYFADIFAIMKKAERKRRMLILGGSSGVAAILLDGVGSFPLHIVPSALIFVVLAAISHANISEIE